MSNSGDVHEAHDLILDGSNPSVTHFLYFFFFIKRRYLFLEGKKKIKSILKRRQVDTFIKQIIKIKKKKNIIMMKFQEALVPK